MKTITIIIIFITGVITFWGCSETMLNKLVTPEMSARQKARYEQQQRENSQLGTIAIGGNSQYVGMKIFINGEYFGKIPKGDITVAYKAFKINLMPGSYKVEIGYGAGRAEGYAEDNYNILKEYVIDIYSGRETSLYVE